MFYSRKYACDREGKEISSLSMIFMIDENGGFGGEFWNSFTKSVFLRINV
jgi:hypothetical protein